MERGRLVAAACAKPVCACAVLGSLQVHRPGVSRHSVWRLGGNWATSAVLFALVAGMHSVSCGTNSRQEHCILLCNFFNYIDRYRRESVGASFRFPSQLQRCAMFMKHIQVGTAPQTYSSGPRWCTPCKQHCPAPLLNMPMARSYCVICDLVPEGEAVVVLRMVLLQVDFGVARLHECKFCTCQDRQSGNCEFWHALKGRCPSAALRACSRGGQRLLHSNVRLLLESSCRKTSLHPQDLCCA